MRHDMLSVCPEQIRKHLRGRTCDLDQISCSESSILLFDDMVLKVQPASNESSGQVRMMHWLKGRLRTPEVIAHAEQDGLRGC